MNALVTGGGGFLGLAIVRRLRARGDRVTVLARGAYPEVEALGAALVRGDIGDADAVRAAADGVDTVFHVAAKAGGAKMAAKMAAAPRLWPPWRRSLHPWRPRRWCRCRRMGRARCRPVA